MSQTNTGNAIGTTDPFWSGPSVGAHTNLGVLSGTIAVDFSGSLSAYQTVTLSGNPHFIVQNMGGQDNLHAVSVRIIGDGSARDITYDAAIRWLNTAPTTQAANKIGVMSLTAYGSNASDVLGVYATES